MTSVVAGDTSVASLTGVGDVDGNGVPDLALGLPALGLVYTVLLEENGTIRSFVLVSSEPEPSFGASVAGLGDVNGDGIGDILVRVLLLSL